MTSNHNIYSVFRSSSTLLSAVWILASAGLLRAEPPQYELLVLEAPDYAVNVVPWGMNDKAQIVGSYGGAVERPFLWDRGEFITFELPPDYSQARCEDINNSGKIVGTMGYWTAPGRAFLYEDGQMIDLGTLEGGNIRGYPKTHKIPDNG